MNLTFILNSELARVRYKAKTPSFIIYIGEPSIVEIPVTF